MDAVHDTRAGGHLEQLLQRRVAEVGEWRNGEEQVLRDLATDGNVYLYELAHDLALVPGLPLFIAVCAVNPRLTFDPEAVPRYRRWSAAPDAETITAALEYALDRPDVEEVSAWQVDDGDLIVLGREPQRYRLRVENRHDDGVVCVYTIRPLDRPHQCVEVRTSPDTLVRREVRSPSQ